MKNTIEICSEYLTGTPIATVCKNLVEEIRYNFLNAVINKDALESLGMDFCEIDMIAAEKLREEVLDNIEVKNVNSFLWEHGFFSNLEEKYGDYFSRAINPDTESYGAYISDISIAITNRIIREHIEQSIKTHYDCDVALYNRAKIYVESGYISKHVFTQLTEQLGKDLSA